MGHVFTFSRPVAEVEADVVVSDLFESTLRALSRQYAAQRIAIVHDAQTGLRLRNIKPKSLHKIVMNLAIDAVQASGPEQKVELQANRVASGFVAARGGNGTEVTITLPEVAA